MSQCRAHCLCNWIIILKLIQGMAHSQETYWLKSSRESNARYNTQTTQAMCSQERASQQARKKKKTGNKPKYVEHGEIKNKQKSVLKKTCPIAYADVLDLSITHTRGAQTDSTLFSQSSATGRPKFTWDLWSPHLADGQLFSVCLHSQVLLCEHVYCFNVPIKGHEMHCQVPVTGPHYTLVTKSNASSTKAVTPGNTGIGSSTLKFGEVRSVQTFHCGRVKRKKIQNVKYSPTYEITDSFNGRISARNSKPELMRQGISVDSV